MIEDRRVYKKTVVAVAIIVAVLLAVWLSGIVAEALRLRYV